MFCRQCGKENEQNSQFCKYCGSPMTEQTEEVEQNTAADITEDEIRGMLESQKAERRRENLQNFKKIPSWLRLIGGILQAVVGVMIVCGIRILFHSYPRYITVGDVIYFPRKIGYIIFGIALLIMSIGEISFFVKRKKFTDKNLFAYIEILVFAIIAFLNIYLIYDYLYGDYTIGIISGIFAKSFFYGNMLRRFVNRTYIHYIDTAVYFMLIISIAMVVIAAIIGIVVTAIERSKSNSAEKSTASMQTRGNKRFIVITSIACIVVMLSFACSIAYNVAHEKYNREEHDIINTIKFGHLDDYPEKNIAQTLDDICEKYDYTNSYWEYADIDSHNWNSQYNKITDDLYYIKTSIYKTTDNKNTDTEFIFKLDKNSNNITVYRISVDGMALSTPKKNAWIETYFGDKPWIEQGEKYKEDGTYISNIQVLYSEPSYSSSTTYKYNNSGTKKILDYIISDDHKILWLKLSGSSDGVYENFWVPQKVK